MALLVDRPVHEAIRNPVATKLTLSGAPSTTSHFGYYTSDQFG